MEDDEDTPAASGDVLLTAAAPVPQMAASAVAEAEAADAAAAATAIMAAPAAAAKAAAMGMAMKETKTKPTEAAKVVQARLLPLRAAHNRPQIMIPTPSCPLLRCKWSSGRARPS